MQQSKSSDTVRNLGSKIVSSGKVFKPKQTVPVASSAAARIMMHNLIYKYHN